MENALRACCKGIKIGKVLIHGEGNDGRQLIYEKLPSHISSRHVLLLDPVLASGLKLLTNHGSLMCVQLVQLLTKWVMRRRLRWSNYTN
ncbi:unnamed protein product [Rhodiola kirilowii]